MDDWRFHVESLDRVVKIHTGEVKVPDSILIFKGVSSVYCYGSEKLIVSHTDSSDTCFLYNKDLFAKFNHSPDYTLNNSFMGTDGCERLVDYLVFPAFFVLVDGVAECYNRNKVYIDPISAYRHFLGEFSRDICVPSSRIYSRLKQEFWMSRRECCQPEQILTPGKNPCVIGVKYD